MVVQRGTHTKCIMLSKISQSEKDKYHMISLMWNLRNKANKQREKKAQETLTYRDQTDITRGSMGEGLGEIGDGD